jgi:uncharacterized membrane protein YbjE (DUF340 family)
MLSQGILIAVFSLPFVICGILFGIIAKNNIPTNSDLAWFIYGLLGFVVGVTLITIDIVNRKKVNKYNAE